MVYDGWCYQPIGLGARAADYFRRVLRRQDF